ncbi:MAG: ribbon-helix-helix domain-containing protein, partial [Thermoproteota archaeon]
WSGMPSMVVSSVRLPKADLELIDALVEAGIFKSRNEGIAFFAHKGIEASRDWLNKVRVKIEEIKRLQEEAKKEMEKIFGEEKS